VEDKLDEAHPVELAQWEAVEEEEKESVVVIALEPVEE